MDKATKLSIFALTLLFGAGTFWYIHTSKKFDEMFSDTLYDFDEKDVEQTLGV